MGGKFSFSPRPYPAQEEKKDMWPHHRPEPPRFPGPPRSLHLTPVDHIVSGWGQMQGAPPFGPGERGGSARCNRSLVRSRSPLELQPALVVP